MRKEKNKNIDVKHFSALARIGLDNEMHQSLEKDLASVLSYVDLVHSFHLKDSTMKSSVFFRNRFRNDLFRSDDFRFDKDILIQTQEKKEECIKIPFVFSD